MNVLIMLVMLLNVFVAGFIAGLVPLILYVALVREKGN